MFIEVTRDDYGNKISINVDSIDTISPWEHHGKKYTNISCRNSDNSLFVLESYAKVKKMIEESMR